MFIVYVQWILPGYTLRRNLSFSSKLVLLLFIISLARLYKVLNYLFNNVLNTEKRITNYSVSNSTDISKQLAQQLRKVRHVTNQIAMRSIWKIHFNKPDPDTNIDSMRAPYSVLIISSKINIS